MYSVHCLNTGFEGNCDNNMIAFNSDLFSFLTPGFYQRRL